MHPIIKEQQQNIVSDDIFHWEVANNFLHSEEFIICAET